MTAVGCGRSARTPWVGTNADHVNAGQKLLCRGREEGEQAKRWVLLLQVKELFRPGPLDGCLYFGGPRHRRQGAHPKRALQGQRCAVGRDVWHVSRFARLLRPLRLPGHARHALREERGAWRTPAALLPTPRPTPPSVLPAMPLASASLFRSVRARRPTRMSPHVQHLARRPVPRPARAALARLPAHRCDASKTLRRVTK